jgi:hypothetical protein
VVQSVAQYPPAPVPAAAAPPVADLAAIYAALLDPNLSPLEIAAKFHLDLADLLELVSRPDLQRRVEALEALVELRLRLIVPEARLSAIRALKDQVDDARTDPVERRRACALLLRALNRPSNNGSASSHPASDISDIPHIPHPPSGLPTPKSTPGNSVCPTEIPFLVIDALRQNDDPEPDAGLATLHAFLDRDASLGPDDEDAGLRTLEEFIEDPPEPLAPLLSAGRLAFHKPSYHDNKILQTVTVYPRASRLPAPPDTPTSQDFHFELACQQRGPMERNWLIRGITTEAAQQTVDSS